MKSFFFKTVLLCTSVVFMLLFLELGSRLVPKYEEPVTVNEDPYIQRIYKPNLDLEVRSEDGGSWVRFKTNSYGFQDDEWETPKKGIRIAHNGDSYVAGQIFYEENFAHRIGDVLAEKIGQPVESLSFGIGRQSTVDEYNTYLHYTKLSNPDIVVLWMYMGNDYHDNFVDVLEDEHVPPPEASLVVEHEKPNLFKRLIQDSELIQLVFRAKERSVTVQKAVSILREVPFVKRLAYDSLLNEPTEEITLVFTSANEARNKKAIELMREYLTKFRDEVAADGKDFFVFILPIQFQIHESTYTRVLEQYPQLLSMDFDPEKPTEVTKELLNELSIPHYDLTELFRDECNGKDSCPMYQCRYCHPSAYGHGRVAEVAGGVLYEKFFKKGK